MHIAAASESIPATTVLLQAPRSSHGIIIFYISLSHISKN